MSGHKVALGNLKLLQSLNIDAQLAVLSDDVLQTIVVDSVYMMLASPEFLVQR